MFKSPVLSYSFSFHTHVKRSLSKINLSRSTLARMRYKSPSQLLCVRLNFATFCVSFSTGSFRIILFLAYGPSIIKSDSRISSILANSICLFLLSFLSCSIVFASFIWLKPSVFIFLRPFSGRSAVLLLYEDYFFFKSSCKNTSIPKTSGRSLTFLKALLTVSLNRPKWDLLLFIV